MESFLHVYFVGIKKHSETRKEVNYVVPRNQTSNFKAFFESFDQRLDEFKVKSYGVSMATLEEVFLKINMEFAPELFGEIRVEITDDVQPRNNSFPKAIGHSVESSIKDPDNYKSIIKEDPSSGEEYLVRGSDMCVTLKANTTKRFIMYRRDWCGIICEVIVPIIMVIIGLQFATQASKLA